MRTIATSLTLAAILATGGTVGAHADDWDKDFSVAGRPKVEIVTDDGHVDVTMGDSHHVVVKIHTTGWRIGPDGIRITPAQDGDRVRVEVREPHFQFGIFLTRRVQIDVIVPRELALDVDTGDGSVTLPALEGVVRVHTGDGSIEADGATGDLRLESGDGRIRADGLQGALYAHTGDGSLRVSGRFTRLELSSGDGRIEAEAATGSKVAEGWDLHTGDGSIALRIPRDLATDLDASTGDGSIDLDLPVAVEGHIDAKQLRGRINGGGGLLRIRSGDGGIRITTL
jgi:hypothetical protein